MEKTAAWLALRNPAFRRLWLAMVCSGSCIGAHNTAVFWALNSLGASTVLISLMTTVVPSWKQHLLQHERMTKNEKHVLLKLRSLRTDPNPPEEWISLSVEKEVLTKRLRTGELPPGYID
jgi:hypothetical protein